MALDLSTLNPAQRDAVMHRDGPLLVLAGPGSGKTRVITWRIAWLIEQGISPWSILAVTFTNKAAGEMRERVSRVVNDGESVRVCTFHSFGAHFLRRERDAAGLPSDFTIFDESDRLGLMRKVSTELGIDKDTASPQQLVRAVSEAKNARLAPADYESKARGWREDQIAKAYHRYEALLRENGGVDFDDLLLKPLQLLKSNESLREEYARRYRYLLVDEYQDTNGVQYELTRLLALGHRNVCVTGDPDQSIYSWRGADITNILNFEKDFPETRVVVLGQNYRSTKTIVAAADALVRNNAERKHKDLYTENEDGRPIRIAMTQSETHESITIARTIGDLVSEEGLDYSGIAIFYRTNAQSRALEAGLREAAIPYVIVGSVEFYRRKEVADVLAWLRLLVNPFDEIAFARAIGAPSRGVGDASIAKIIAAARSGGLDLVSAAADGQVQALLRGKPKAGLAEFAGIMKELRGLPRTPVEDVLSRLLTATALEDFLRREDPLRGDERAENVKELLSDAAIFDEQNHGADVSAYLERVSLIQDVDKWDPSRRAVSLMTLHSAKGLEFPAVFITGLEDGYLPHSRSITGESGDLEEERRLFYVGITRAEKFLTLTLARTREQFGQSMRNSASRFLHELPVTAIETEDLTGGMFGIGLGAGKERASMRTPFDDAEQPEPDAHPANDDDAGDNVVVEDDDGTPVTGGLRRLQGGRILRPSAGDMPHNDGARRRISDQSVRPDNARRPAGTPGALAQGDLQVGDRVKHQMFGVGTVVSFTPHAGGTRARIMFAGWGEKNLALEFARLEKV